MIRKSVLFLAVVGLIALGLLSQDLEADGFDKLDRTVAEALQDGAETLDILVKLTEQVCHYKYGSRN